MTFLFYSNYTIGDIYPSFNAFYLRKSAVLKWKTLLPHINFQWSGGKFMAAIFKSSLQNLSPVPTSLKFFVNTTKPKTKVLAGFGQKLETKVSTLSLSCG